jgi:hypothetical protein
MGKTSWVLSTKLRRLGFVSSAAILALGVAGPADAAVRHVRIEIHESFTADFYSEACGTEVVVTLDASLNVTLRYNRAGLLVQEIDPSGGGAVTTSAPETGNSFTYPFSSTVIDYGAGAVVGGAFTARFVGVIGVVPGFIPADAGEAVFTGTVSGFDDLGIPSLDFSDLIAFHGHLSDGDAVVDATCRALTS